MIREKLLSPSAQDPQHDQPSDDQRRDGSHRDDNVQQRSALLNTRCGLGRPLQLLAECLHPLRIDLLLVNVFGAEQQVPSCFGVAHMNLLKGFPLEPVQLDVGRFGPLQTLKIRENRHGLVDGLEE